MPKTFTIAIGSDHAGFKYKEAIKAFLRDKDKTQRIMGGECECEDLSPWKSSGRVQRPSGL